MFCFCISVIASLVGGAKEAVLWINEIHKEKVMSRHLVWMLLSLYAVSVNADWITIGSSPAQQLEHFIDKDSVKQSGPMAIFRQVQVLRQGSELKKKRSICIGNLWIWLHERHVSNSARDWIQWTMGSRWEAQLNYNSWQRWMEGVTWKPTRTNDVWFYLP